MSIYPKNSGFTLIELLVVMVILGITSSLVAPDLFSIVKRSQAKTELEKIKAISELSIERSFFAASQIGILFKDNTVIFSQLNQSVGIDNKVLKTITSEFFTFEETQVVINKGNWEGSALVKLTKSPDNKLKTFFLLKTNDATKATTINKDNDEGMSSESEDSEK